MPYNNNIKPYGIIIGFVLFFLSTTTTYADLAGDVAKNPEATREDYNAAMSFCNGERGPKRIKRCIEKLNRGYRRHGDSWLTTSASTSNDSSSSSTDILALQAELATTKQTLVEIEQQLSAAEETAASATAAQESMQQQLASKQNQLNQSMQEKSALQQQLESAQASGAAAQQALSNQLASAQETAASATAAQQCIAEGIARGIASCQQ
jgi:chromosome segregation ATPase